MRDGVCVCVDGCSLFRDFEQANAPESIKNGLIYNVCDKRGPLKNYQRTSQFSSDPLCVSFFKFIVLVF